MLLETFIIGALIAMGFSFFLQKKYAIETHIALAPEKKKSRVLPRFFLSEHCKEFMEIADSMFLDYLDMFSEDPEGPWWEKRNVVGASIFHKMILLGRYSLARSFIEALQKESLFAAARYLISSPYKNGLVTVYDGENALHMVIAKRDIVKNDNLDMLDWLCTECPSLVQGRATGRFFQTNSYEDMRKDVRCL